MNITQIRELKYIMENEIRLHCEKHMYEFYTKTGLSPSSINVNLIDVTKLGERNKQYMLGRVNCVLEIT